MYTKLFSSILDSSVWLEDLPTKVLWITMLAMADEDGIVRASVGGLAKRAGITREDCERGLGRFLAADLDSRNEDNEGRRIEKVAGGWLVLNHKQYREIRTKRQSREADRQRRHREKVARDKDVTSVTDVTERDSHDSSRSSRHIPPIASASSSVGSFQAQEPIPEKEPEGKEGAKDSASDPLDAVLTDAKLDLTVFPDDAASEIKAFLRAQRAPLSVALVLASHLTDVHGPPSTPAALALAVREWTANAEEKFSARYFAAFVKRADKVLAGKPGRVQAKNEERFITETDVMAERSRREEAEATALLTDFERTHGDEFETLKARAEASVDRKVKGIFRMHTVRAALVKMIRERGADATR
jgi:hypothetical protein